LTDSAEVIPSAREVDAYLGVLKALIVREAIDLLLPTHPLEIRVLTRHGAALPVRLLLPARETILRAQDRWHSYQLLEGAGVAVPRTFKVDSASDLQRCFDAIASRPIWVRGAEEAGTGISVASLPCRELGHAVAWVDHFRGWGRFIASEYLPGRSLGWCALFDQGELIAAQGRERLEDVLPPVSPGEIRGAPAVSRTISSSELHRTGEAAVRAIDPRPHGAFLLDLKGDELGVPRVTGINAGRFGTTVHFYTEAGFNFPRALVELAAGRRPPQVPLIDPVPPGCYWIRTLDGGPVLVRDLDEAR
jgi:carbamoyl-phosphate synthase large subunit